MLHRSSSSPDPDRSSCSSDTGSVLIRSTRVLLKDHGPGPGPGPRPGSVHITVQKLREDPVFRPPQTEQQPRSSGTQRQQRPDRAAPLRAAAAHQPGVCADRRTLKKPELTKENRQPPADMKLSAGTHTDRQPGGDVLTSRFAAGGRGVVLEALKQRSHSAPRRREVRVQLLDPGPLRTSSQDAPGLRTSSQDAVGVAGVQMEAGLSSGCPGDETKATAAALIKAQSQVEAQVSQLAEGVQKLLQADREGGDRGRSLSQQTLHHLETLHSQQLQLQSQLLESALRMVMGHAPVTSTTSDLMASGQPAHLQVTHLDPAANVLSNQQPSSSATRTAAAATTPYTGPVAMETPCCDRWPEQTRGDQQRRAAPTDNRPATQSHLQTSASHSQATAARRANEMLREMGRLKSEMKMLLTSEGLPVVQKSEDSLKTTRPESDHHQSQHSQSQHSQSQHSQSQHSQSQHSQSQHSQSQHSQSHHSQSQHSQSQHSQSQHSQSQHSQSHHSQSQHSQSQHSQSQHSQSQHSQSQHSQSQQIEPQQSQTQHFKSQQIPSQSHQGPLQQVQSQPNDSQSQPSQFHSQHSQSQQIEPQQSHSQQSKSHQNQSQSQHVKSQQIPSQSHQGPFQQIQSQHSQTHPTLSQQSQSVLAQRRPVVPSMMEEAGQVLRQVRRQKKVLEENLETLLRVQTGEVLNCQLEALAANRDWTEEVRIKKTVDAWIDTLTKDIQAEMSSEDAVSKHSASRDAAVTSQQRAAGSSAHTGRGRAVSMLRGTGSKTAAGTGGRGQTAGHRAGAEPGRASGGLTEDGESYLTRLYGRAPYDGMRRTLKKSPYLRFSSPVSPLSRKPRPRLVESVRGVKVKSCKTQTCLAPPLSPPPGPPQHHYIISPTHLTSADATHLTVTPADSYFVPMAIPLGRPRMDSSSRCPAERQQEVTSPPTAPPTCSVVVVDDGASELQSQEEEQPAAGEAHPPPPPPPPPADIVERESEEEEDEENVFPGTDFLSVADVVQEEVSVVGEEEVQLDGGPSPPPVLYQGPVFPPQALPASPAQDQTSVSGIDLQREALENRLVEWVEQQLMSRVISEMYRPPPSDPAQNNSTDQSEPEERSVTSDIVEAAGGGGLQLFIDSNVSVDSALIRQLVDEVLTEHVALLLGHRETPEPGLEPEPEPGPGPAAHQEHKLVTLVPTPVPTPPPSPAPPSRETPPLTTPPLSEPTSLLDEESPQPITAAEHVATPTSSPEPAHSAGSPPAVHQAPPPLTWGDAELPLEEERPEEHLDTHPQPLLMSVAEEEPPLSSPPTSIPPAPSPSPPPPPPPGLDPRPASPSSSSEDSSSTSSSSSSSSSSSGVVTAGTEAALKHISEGELLISVNQLAAMTEEEAVCSFSSSLQELQEMDFDPPSEGQVRGHDLLLTLLTKMEQGVTHTHRGERPQPEGSWGRDQQEEEEEEVSVGEVRDDQTTKPHRTTNPKSTAGHRGQTCSPGQISQCADVSEVSFEVTNQGLVTVGDLMVEPVGTLTSDLQTDPSLSPPPPPHLEDTYTAGQVVPVLVTQFNKQSGGSRRMDVHLPSIRLEEEEEEEEEVMMEEVMEVSAADTDSSTNDVF